MTDSSESIETKSIPGELSETDISFYKILLDNLYDGVYFVDLQRRISYWNRGAERLTGYSSQEAVGRSCFDNFLAHVDDKGCALCIRGCPLKSTMEDGKPREAEIYLRHRFGHRVPVSVRAAPIRNGTGTTIGAVEIFTDISDKKRAERRAGELEGLAYLDALTALANRRFMQLKVQQALEEVKQFGRGMGLLMIDVDRFKQVNDTFGHEAGDLVLKAVSHTLTACLRPTDIVGRWGGEEFLVLVNNMHPSSFELGKIAERCRNLIAKSRVTLGSDYLSTTASVGGTLVLVSDSEQSVLRRVDELMYRSKVSGRNLSSIG
jgi:diguanylate cyclase (GGDEF)-like protein/PAS domain S-box-containing protein